MEQGFIDILKKLVKEQGHIALTDAKKCKAFLGDYTGSDYRKERRLIQQAAEAGIAKAIAGAQDLASCKKAQVRELEEEFSLSPAAAADIVDALALVLRGDTSRTKAAPQAAPPKAAPQAAPPKAAPKPAALPTDAAWVMLLESGEVRLDGVPEAERTAAVCRAGVKQRGYDLQYVPENLKTPELCLEAVKQDGCALKHVPKNLKTPELCLEAVKQEGTALEHVPESLKTLALCLVAVKNTNHSDGLYFVPERLKTPELCLAAVKQCGAALVWVPENLKTHKICLEAVKQHEWALDHVPESLKTLEIMREHSKWTRYRYS